MQIAKAKKLCTNQTRFKRWKLMNEISVTVVSSFRKSEKSKIGQQNRLKN